MENTTINDEEILKEFLNAGTAPPGFVISVPDVQIDPLPDIPTSWNVGVEDDQFSEYSLVSASGTVGGTTNGGMVGMNSNNGPNSANTQSNPSPSFLSVPTQIPYGGRRRSPSICSNYSELSENYGSVANPFPDSKIVIVPPAWIGYIPSPTNSAVSSDFGGSNPPTPLERNMESLFTDFSGNTGNDTIPSAYSGGSEMNDTSQYVSFDDFFASISGSENNMMEQQIQGDMFLSLDGQTSASDYRRFSNNSVEAIPSSDDQNNFIPKSESLTEYRSTTVPDGKFWKTVKQNGQTLYQCPFEDCTKMFTRPYNLKSHYRAHTGERPYVCNNSGCAAAFSRKHDLKRHLKLHSGEKEFVCKACNKSFSRNDALGRHLRPSESGGKESICALKLQLAEKDKLLISVLGGG